MVERAEAWAAVAVVVLLPLVQALLLLAAGYVGARLASRAAGAALRRMGEERREPATELLRSAGLSIAVAKGLQARSEQPAPSRSGSACCWWRWQRLKRWRWTR